MTAAEVLDQPGAPVVMFDKVALAFDDRVILHDVSFTLLKGHTKIILGASGAGKSTILKLMLGLLKPDAGIIWVNGERVDLLNEREMMAVRADLGMVFQEGALFDSLTVRENVGFKLYEDGAIPVAQIDGRVEEVVGFVGLAEHIDKMPSELSGGQRRRVAIARAMTKLRDLEGVSSIVVTHQLRDAFYVAEHEARREHGTVHVQRADQEKSSETEFLMLRDGRVHFEGNAHDLRASADDYIRNFLS
jgi:phospholipid/cholesterol/gamma-HCH transport system ATP-binding protein